MPQTEPVLRLASALPFFDTGALPNVPLDLVLMPGDCALIETFDPARATAFADLCSGMIALQQGEIRFMGYDWAGLDSDRAAALRGRIGRIHQKGAWIGMFGIHVNIMLAQLHHTREPELTAPLLDLLSRALHRGAAAVCFTRDAPFWAAQRFPVRHRLQLRDDGLRPMAAV